MTDYMAANTINDLFRSLFAMLDRVAYWLLGIMYEILFNVASADIFSNDTIHNFYGRIQLIIGVFMVFKLAVSIIQGIINPDTFTDKKSGFSNIIKRIIFALIMLVVITPINIPSAKNEYEIQLNNNGLLFGTLYSLQTRILQNNTLGRLILGTTDNSVGLSTSSNGSTTQAQKLQQSANIFTSTILKGFVRINLKDGGTDEKDPNDRVCREINQEVLDAYTALDASPNQILSLVNASCEGQNEGFFERMAAWFKRIFSGDRYVFAYMPVISTIVAVVFIYILLGEIITIAIRTVKLAVLRLIAPIPIISYIDPKSEKDGAFGAWVKSLTETYLELFIHLAVIYFIIFLIQDMIVNGIVINTGTGIIGIISMIFIWIGLFFFIRQAPKFIRDVLGIKGAGTNIGLSGLAGGTAMLAGGGGLRGFALGAMSGTEAAIGAYNQGKAAPLGDTWNQMSNQMAEIRTGRKGAQGGIIGGMRDRLDYSTRERRADLLHINRDDLANADYEKGLADSRARKAQYELEMASRELTANPSGTAGYDAALRRYNDAYAANERAKSDLARRTKAAEKMEKDRAALGLDTDVEARRRVTYRSARQVRTTTVDNTYDASTDTWSMPDDAPGNSWKFADGTTDNPTMRDLSNSITDRDAARRAAQRAQRTHESDTTDFR